MKFNRSIGLLLASTAFLSVSSAAFALDGDDLLAKVNALSASSGTTLAAQSTEVDGDTVKLIGVTVKVSGPDTQTMPIGDVTLEGVTESDDGYEIEKASFQDIDFNKDGNGVTAQDLYIAGISVPANPEPGTLSSVLLFSSFHVGPVSITANNKEVASVEESVGNYTVADDESKVDFDATISGLKIDTTSAPDPKAQEAIKALGLETINGEITMKGSWTLADGKMDISEYAFDFENIGRLDINFAISGYTLDFLKSMQEAMKAAESNPDKAAGQQALGMAMMGLMQQLSYDGASIRFDDAGITAKVLDYAGKQQGVDGPQFAQSIKGMLPLMLGQLKVPELQTQISDAANAYLDDPKSIEVSAEPDQSLPFPQIMGAAMGDPAGVVKLLNVQVTANE